MGDASSGALSLDRGDPQATFTGTCCNPGARHALHHRQHSRPRQAGAGAEAGGPRQCPSRACGAHVSPGRTLSPGLPEPPPHAAPTTAPGGHGAATLPTGPAATRRRCRASCTTPGARARGGPVAPPGGAVVLRPGARRDVISERTLKGKSQLREFSGWHICCSIPEIVPQRSGYLLYSHRQDDKLERTVTISLCELPPLF